MSTTRDMAESTDIAEHERTFHSFVRMVRNAAILCIVILIFVALVNG
ncbi:aa3-type cytochrome c oxidase subunit IV [Tropicimonas sp.]